MAANLLSTAVRPWLKPCELRMMELRIVAVPHPAPPPGRARRVVAGRDRPPPARRPRFECGELDGLDRVGLMAAELVRLARPFRAGGVHPLEPVAEPLAVGRSRAS